MVEQKKTGKRLVNRWILIGVGGGLIILAGVLILLWALRSSQQPQIDLQETPELIMSDTYYDLGPAEARAKIIESAGVDIVELEKRTITRQDFESFNEAYVTAQAFIGLDKLAKAREVFAIADQMGPGDMAPKFYISYAASMESETERLKYLEKAMAAAKASTALNQDQKDKLVQQIDELINPMKYL